MASSVAPLISDWKDLYWSSEEFNAAGTRLHCTFCIYINPADLVYVAEIVQRKAKISIPSINASLEPVSDQFIFPKWPPRDYGMLRSQNPLPVNVTVNRALLDKYIIFKNYNILDLLGVEMMQEIAAMEAVRQKPHPHIVNYHGCQVRRGYITGIVHDAYPLDLNHYLAAGTTMSVPEFMQDLRSAVTHVHALGLVHNDIRPENIYINQKGRPVLAGFSMCRRIGASLSSLQGADAWAGARYSVAHVNQDLYSLDLLEQWLYACSEPVEMV